MMAAVLGVKEVQTISDNEIRITYDLDAGKKATLAIYSDVSRRLSGAQVGQRGIYILPC